MKQDKRAFRELPGVDKLLQDPYIVDLIKQYTPDIIKFAIRVCLQVERDRIINGHKQSDYDSLLKNIKLKSAKIFNKSLKPVINATGIVMHTNLGRAPFGEKITRQALEIIKGYNNLEFDLKNGKRGSRNSHVSELLKYLTGAEDVLVVNNNAAAIMLILRTFARNREVIISRSELIEIGGSFRLPDIMTASDCIMKEVGTTNKTKPDDFENAISTNTALLFKAHKSNYSIQGFTQEVNLQGLIKIGERHELPVVYDIGSGLLRRPDEKSLNDEPDVKQSIRYGTDLVCFSGDKLLGGPQAGIIAGKKEYIGKLKKEQMTRALRVGKVTLAFLEAACRNYIDDNLLFKDNMIFNMLRKSPDEIKQHANKIKSEFEKKAIAVRIEKSKARYGGGTLPDKEIDSFSIVIDKNFKNSTEQSKFSERLHRELMQEETAVVSVLRSGTVYFDVLTIFEDEIPDFINTVAKHSK